MYDTDLTSPDALITCKPIPAGDVYYLDQGVKFFRVTTRLRTKLMRALGGLIP